MNDTNFLTLSHGSRLCYAEYGDPQGQPVFYFHGWPSSRLQASLLHEHALELKARIIAPDRPGVGLSDFMENRQLLDWPETVCELADHLSIEQFSVIGVSGGGPYALACAASLASRVTRAEIICGAPPLAKFDDLSEMMWPYRALLVIRPHTPWLFPPILRVAHWISTFPSHQPPLSWAIKWTGGPDRDILLSDAHTEFTESFREGLKGGTKGIMSDGDVYTADWKIDFSQITTPIQFWHGEKDKNIPHSMVKRYSGWIPSATFRSFENEGHYSIAINTAKEALINAMNEG